MSPQAWVGALQVGDEENWETCKATGLWGTGSHQGGGVRAGDQLFIWRSQTGWLARCLVTSDATPPTLDKPAPWADGRNYRWMFGIQVVGELDHPVNPGSDHGIQRITGILNVKLGQFPRLSDEQLAGVSSFFGLTSHGIVDPVEEIHEREADDSHEAQILRRKDIGPQEKERLVFARTGQGRFRKNLLEIENSCRVTGLNVTDYLIASHIKPWRYSDDFEKIDGNNGLLLSPHVDKLFDQGWIMFRDDGIFRPSPLLDVSVLAAWRLEQPSNPKPFNEQQREYLEYHRESIFKQSAA
jgi:HNH endonuclease